MAEVVGCLQERSIPEYELMRKYQVFTDEQIRGVIRTRENYQYKVSRSAKCLKDYVEYIKYEKSIHDLISANPAKEKFAGLKMVMSNRIVRLFREALRGFPEENRLWEKYLKFCKNNFPSEVPNAYEKLIQHHGDKPSVWCNAAMWFHEQGNNMEKVKSIFFRGLQRHPESEILYTAFFTVLLSETANQPADLVSASLARVTAIYNSAKKKICNVSFLTHLVKLCEEERFASFSRPLQKTIISDMMLLYPREEIVWDLLAQRELKGACTSEKLGYKLIVPIPEEQNDKDDANDKNDKDDKNNEGNKSNKVESNDKADVVKPTLKRRIETSFCIYQTAVSTLKTPLMWSLFINAMLELNTDLSTQQVLKRRKLAMAFKGCYESNNMSEDHYFAYIALLSEIKSNRDLVLTIMTEATERFGTIKLWEQCMSFHIMEDNQPKVYEVFRRATRKLGPESYPLWRLALQYYQTRYDDQYERLIEIYKEACAHIEPAFSAFRPQYLEWSVVNQPFHITRKLYGELSALSPPCLELHQKMFMLESQTLKPDMDKLRHCYENATAAFGKTRTDVWIDYIKFEREQGEPKRVSTLVERAKRTLESKYVVNFINEHMLLTIGN